MDFACRTSTVWFVNEDSLQLGPHKSRQNGTGPRTSFSLQASLHQTAEPKSSGLISKHAILEACSLSVRLFISIIASVFSALETNKSNCGRACFTSQWLVKQVTARVTPSGSRCQEHVSTWFTCRVQVRGTRARFKWSGFPSIKSFTVSGCTFF